MLLVGIVKEQDMEPYMLGTLQCLYDAYSLAIKNEIWPPLTEPLVLSLFRLSDCEMADCSADQGDLNSATRKEW